MQPTVEINAEDQVKFAWMRMVEEDADASLLIDEEAANVFVSTHFF